VCSLLLHAPRREGDCGKPTIRTSFRPRSPPVREETSFPGTGEHVVTVHAKRRLPNVPAMYDDGDRDW
jgi:hypothetical protein